MNALGALGMGRSIAAASLRLSAAALLVCASASNAAPAPAGDPPDDTVVAQAFVPGDEGPRMEMSTSTLPHFDSVDGATRSSRVDMTLLPTPQSTLGPSIAMTSVDGRGLSANRAFAGSPTSVDLGLHWRYTSDGKHRVDITAWRRLNPVDAANLVQSADSNYGARVEMHLDAAHKSGFVADHGFLGFQLEGGARITLRKSGGKPMLYYRTSF